MIDLKVIKGQVQKILAKLQEKNVDDVFADIRKELSVEEGKSSRGTSISVIRMIGEEIGKYGQKHPDAVMSLLEKLWQTGGREERFCAGHAFGDMGKVHYQRVLPVMYVYLADVDWETLEAMAWGVGKIVSAHPAEVIPILKEWAEDRNRWVRKSVSHAMVILLNRTKKAGLDNIMSVMDILIKDDDEEVRKSIGFVLRQVSRLDPQCSAAFFDKWVKEEDQYIRWNIANGARNSGKEVLPVLKELAGDKRKFVRRASASALKDIARKHNEIAGIIAEWQNDPDEGVREVAAAALSYVKKK